MNRKRVVPAGQHDRVVLAKCLTGLLPLLMLGLVLAACGGDDAGTTVVAAEPLARARAKADAAAAVLSGNYTSVIDVGETELAVQGGIPVFAACLDEGGLSSDELDSVTAAVVTMTATGLLQDSALPSPSGSVEARVFNSETEAEDAFAVLERVFGSDGGRACLADALTEAMADQTDDQVEVGLTVEAWDLVGADIGSRVNLATTAQGAETVITMDIAASREGDLTTFGSFFGFDEEFPAELATALMTA